MPKDWDGQSSSGVARNPRRDGSMGIFEDMYEEEELPDADIRSPWFDPTAREVVPRHECKLDSNYVCLECGFDLKRRRE